MKKHEQVGTVVRMEGEQAVVELKPDPHCSSLQCACSAHVHTAPRLLRVPRANLEEGDLVSVLTPAYVGHVSTFVIFVLPLVLAITGGMVGAGMEGETGVHGATAFGGVVLGFGAAVVVAVIVNRVLQRPGLFEVKRIKEGR